MIATVSSKEKAASAADHTVNDRTGVDEVGKEQ
jgi:hypothetical protein